MLLKGDAMLKSQLSSRCDRGDWQYRKWAPARFFYVLNRFEHRKKQMTELQSQIEERLAAGEPEVEVLLAEIVGAGTLRVFIDHPGGVTLALCERVTVLLSDLRERYALEVSSPGTQRPLTKPNHFRSFVGRRARIRTHWPTTGSAGPPAARVAPAADRRRPISGSSPGRHAQSFTGELVGATNDEVTLAADEGIIVIPYSEIRRCNLIEE
jgi:ribosome maturation factor RimP